MRRPGCGQTDLVRQDWAGISRRDREAVGHMITSVHSIIYATDADATRAFLRDVIGLRFVDAHDGWLIFQQPPSEVAVHPEGEHTGKHELYLMCDDIEATMAELAAKGVQFTAPVRETSFGLLTSIQLPGSGEIGLYEPRHPTAYDL
jgi:catechol 2,3-dioxygenase-like lactoylglutathione lyase family enzyme